MDYYNLTTPQKNIWNLQKYYENTAIGNQCGAIFYEGKQDPELLKQAICQFIQNQSGMRLRFLEKNGPVQYISKDLEDIPVKTFASMDEFDIFAGEFAQKPIGIHDTAMYRFVIFQTENKTGILAVLNHLISDAWTFGIMANQIDAAYHNITEGTCHVLWKEDYTEYIQSDNHYLSSETYTKDKLYWEQKYSVRPEKNIMKIAPPKIESIKAGRVTKTLSADLKYHIEKYCDVHRITPPVLFETILIIYLSRINPENNSITIGVPVLNRKNVREKRTAGMFVSTMPLTVNVKADMTVIELANQIAGAHMEIFKHQNYPYSDILKSIREKHDFSGNLYNIMISYQNAKTDTGTDTKWYPNGYSEIPLIIHIDNRDGHNSYTINVDYQTAVYDDEKEVMFIVDRLDYILKQIMDETAKTIKDVLIVPQAEQNKIIEEFNATHIEYPKEKCIHELFSAQAKKTPDKVALVFKDKTLTYRQLDEISDSLAYLLVKKGIKPGDIVPIISRKSWHVIMAILGILKAGGAYMPIAPDYPKERVQFIISNTKSTVACVLEYHEKINEIEFIDLDHAARQFTLNNYKLSFVTKAVNPDNLCYIIFTSGSSGQPKGVMITHKNLYNYVMTVQKTYKIKYFDMSLITNIYVDLSVTATFLPILTGGTLEIVDKDWWNGLKYIADKSDSVYKLTPTHVDMMIEMNLELPQDSTFILGGEAIKPEHIEYICRKGQLINEYGPTETTVGCCIKTYERKTENYDITIGSPIANTQLYILNGRNEPLPIGVAGELCIAGSGVGNGYLNLPELTAEKFISNPFATEENHHGKIIYRTGDLARWKTNGEIEYLGRIDTQVKIRGLRIELGEIESVMSSFTSIGLTAAADKKDENNRQYIVGYYTSERKIDEKELRQHLLSKLPQYMIPNYFMRLDEMPMAPSGKTDRNNLPLPRFVRQEREYTAPKTKQEKKLCVLLASLLHMEKVGVEDDFFECGGDSLAAIEYVTKAHSVGIEFSLQNVFDYPTVGKLCRFINRGFEEKVHYKASDFDRYSELLSRNITDDSISYRKKSPGNVLLTGATGFLGAHVLDKLMQEEKSKIYCLIRGRNQDDIQNRLDGILRYYFGNKYESEINHRIIPVAGDIEQEGLSDELPSDVQTIIHAAASVKHYGAYDYFYRINVQGTGNVIDYAQNIGAKLIHISTLSVSGNSLTDDFPPHPSEKTKIFCESSFYIGQALDNVYIHSKFEAEKKVYDAMLSGLNAIIIRIGNLTNRTSDFKFQPNFRENAFLTRLKAILEFGLFPDYLMNLRMEFSPVDKTAEGIVKITQYADKQCVFHLNSNKGILFKHFLETVSTLYIPVDIVNESTFINALQKTMRHKDTEYIYEAFQNDMDKQGHILYDSNIHIKNDFTLWFLKKTGFEWSPTDPKYIKGYINYFRQIGYLKV